MAREIPWRKTLGARLGLLSVAILVSAILLIAADFRMLGEIDAAMAQTNMLGHHRSDAYQLLALTERLARDTGEQRAITLGEVRDVRGEIDHRFDRRGESALPGPQTFWRSQIMPALDQLMAGHDPATLSALNATVKRYVAEMDESQRNVDAAARRDADRFRTIQYGFLLFVAFVCLVTLYLLPSINLKLRPKLFRELKPGTRIVSHAFDMRGYKPDKKMTVKDVIAAANPGCVLQLRAGALLRGLGMPELDLGELLQMLVEEPRVVDAFAKRLQVQEKLTAEWIDHCLVRLGERELQRI